MFYFLLNPRAKCRTTQLGYHFALQSFFINSFSIVRLTENREKWDFAWEKKLKYVLIVLQTSNWAQNVPWKKVGLGCNNYIALS